MQEVVLSALEIPSYTLEAECITPENFAGKSAEEIGKLPVYYGNVKAELGEFFEISGKPGDKPEETRIVITGDVSLVKRIGQEMGKGEIVIKGSSGMYTGAYMKGGKIVVEGDSGDFSGLMMRGGELHIMGNAGNYLGATYRGDRLGMRGGIIVVEGNAGLEVGGFLNGGKIIVKGNTGSFAGVHMKKGLIAIYGRAGKRVGAQMIGGTIVANAIESLLPGFELEGEEENPEIEGERFDGKFRVYSGHHAERNAKGRLYVRE